MEESNAKTGSEQREQGEQPTTAPTPVEANEPHIEQEHPFQPPAYQPPGDGQQIPSPSPYAPYSGQGAVTPPPPPAGPTDYAQYAPAPAQRTNQAIWYWLASIVAITLAAVGFLVGGEPAKFMTIGVEIAPLAILAALAFAGTRNNVAMIFTYLWLGIVALGVLFNSLGSVLLVVMQPGALTNPAGANGLSGIFKPEAGPALLWTLLLLTIASLISLAMLLRPVRVLMTRIMPIDPDNFVHKIALCILTLILLTSFAPLIALGGRPPILELIKSDTSGIDTSSISAGPLDLLYQFVWTIPAVLVGAGWPVVRKFKDALVRLGMVRPTVVQVAAGIGLGLALALIAGVIIDPGINSIWTSLGWSTTDTAAFDKLLSRLISLPGAVLVGVTAGVGEEMAVRGLLQPRIGLIASNLVFTSLHAFQYGPDALLSVFIVGLILGIIRARSNTTTSAIVHGVYDFTLVLASALAGTSGP